MKRTQPEWTRDELILALDVYFQLRVDPVIAGSSHPEIIALSNVLKSLPIHLYRPDPERFRNPTGVYMHLLYFLWLDPARPGRGVDNGSILARETWDEFRDERRFLHRLAMSIRAFTAANVPEGEQTGDDYEAFEGRLLFGVHRYHERSKGIVQQKIAQALRTRGSLSCETCSFNFSQFYGAIGEGYIECHHTVPLVDLAPGHRTRVTDLALVCANCHRMLHRTRRTLTMAELSAALCSTA